jgi:hypothetical protein
MDPTLETILFSWAVLRQRVLDLERELQGLREHLKQLEAQRGPMEPNE